MRIIVVNTSRIGDLVSGMGVVNHLRDRFGTVDLLPEPRYATLVEGEPGVRVVAPLEARGNKYDLLLDLSASRKSERFIRPIRAGRKVCLAGSFLKRLRARLFYSTVLRREDPHIVNGHLPFLRMFGESAMPVPRLTPGADEKILAVFAHIREDSGNMLAGIHIDAASERRVLPEELVLGTIKRLDSLGMTAILLGTNSDIAHRIKERTGGRAHHLEFTLAGLKTALAGLDLFIGPDSGPLHVAAALGVPCVGVYGPNIPARSGPIAPNVRIVELPLPCRPCNQNRPCPRTVACIAGIDPSMIADAARDVTGQKS